MKKYLNTFEDIEALRNTDTKIYCDSEDGYLQFVNGWPCWFFQDGNKLFGGGIFLSSNPYIELPDEPDKSWIGKLGWVSDVDSDDKTRCGLNILESLFYERISLRKKLDIAVKALRDIVKDYEINGPCEEDCVGFYMTSVARKALKEIEED